MDNSVGRLPVHFSGGCKGEAMVFKKRITVNQSATNIMMKVKPDEPVMRWQLHFSPAPSWLVSVAAPLDRLAPDV